MSTKYPRAMTDGVRKRQWEWFVAKWTQDQNLKGSIPSCLKRAANCNFELNWVMNIESFNLRSSVTGEMLSKSIFKNDQDSWGDILSLKYISYVKRSLLLASPVKLVFCGLSPLPKTVTIMLISYPKCMTVWRYSYAIPVNDVQQFNNLHVHNRSVFLYN